MKIAVLGASRGLGAALVAHIHKESSESVLLLSSRRESELKSLASRLDWVVPADFAKTPDQENLLKALHEFQPEKIFYVAGGGPFGNFADKDWKDHSWALEVNFNFPARLLHHSMRDDILKRSLRQMLFVGSAIAGQKPDPKASSYAAAKHALRGLVTSVKAENPVLDLRLFEPGYMDTSLLPANAWPRQQGIVASADVEARKLWQMSQSSVD
jgi:short-subunit dehydrogenase